MLPTERPAEGICKVCHDRFIKYRSLQTICGKLRCAKQVGKLARKAERESVKKRRNAIKKRSEWLAEVQAEVNLYCRLRDAGNGCISCGTHQGKANGGHFMSVGARPELRFDEANIHLQCERCNTYLHGNLLMYRINLIAKIGQAEVDRLEGPQSPKKYTIADLEAMKAVYRRKAKEIEG